MKYDFIYSKTDIYIVFLCTYMYSISYIYMHCCLTVWGQNAINFIQWLLIDNNLFLSHLIDSTRTLMSTLFTVAAAG